MERIVVVSADGHVGGPPEIYREYLEPRYRELLDTELSSEQQTQNTMGQMLRRYSPDTLEVFDPERRFRQGGATGAWVPERRLLELDAEGIAAEVVHPGVMDNVLPFFNSGWNSHPPEVRAAGARAYHRWLTDFMSVADGRIVAQADCGPCLDLSETVKELDWVASHGFVSVSLPGNVADADLPPLFASYHEPFWAACEDLGLVLNVHAGWGMPQGFMAQVVEGMGAGIDGLVDQLGTAEFDLDVVTQMFASVLDADSPDSPFALDLGPRQAMWQLMIGGVFDRHPGLKFVLTEVRADWVPATLAILDALAKSRGIDLQRLPSDYFATNCAVTPSSPHRAEIELRSDIGIDQFMFGADFPHPEGTWPNTHEWLRVAFAGVEEAEARKMLGENAIAFYGLDREKLLAVASRIGPNPAEVVGDDRPADEKLLAHFHQRAGYAKGSEQVDEEKITARFDNDLALLGGG